MDEEELELLRQFDLAWQYGPCTGITRLQRWHRAEQMGLKPPPEVHQVLQSHPGIPASSAASGISTRSDAPPKTSCLLLENRTQVRASCCPTVQLCCGEHLAGKRLTGKERG